MNARHVTLLLAFVATALAPSCKGRARFKPRASSFPRSLSTPDFRSPRAFDVDDLSSASDREVDALLRREVVREVARTGLKDELTTALESAVERHCASTSTPRYLEPQGAGLQSLFRTMRRVNAPSDVSVPPATTVMGLPVQVMVVDAEDPRWCADGDAALVRDVARTQGPARSSLVKVTPGAWLVLTSHGAVPASSALVSESFLSSLGVAGSLVAFAPTDHAIAFADASKPEAIRQAAKALWGHVDVTGNDGVLQSQPLVLTKGEWRGWKPTSTAAEVATLRRLTDELETKMAADLTTDLIETAEALRFVSGAGLPPLDLVDGVKTSRLVDEKRRVRVTVDLDSDEAQVIGRADVVRLSSAAGQDLEAEWAAFSSTAGARLTPVKVDGVVVPNVFRLAPSFTWPSGAPLRLSSRAGRRPSLSAD
jgi:hypothetical protein